MKPARLLLLLALAVWSSGASAQTPSAAGAEAPAPEALLKAAEAHLAAGRVESALAGLREVLVRRPDDHDLRLRLAGLLLDRQRHAEALPEIRRVLAARPDVAAHTAWLRALDAVGAPLERALAAEEAIRRHPGHVPFTWAAIEALSSVGAHDQALGHWRRLTKADQTSSRGQALLGAIHEAAGRLAEALAAYHAAGDEPSARDALARLRGRALDLGGVLYFPPPGWTATPGAPPSLTDLRAGLLATPLWLAGTKPQEALRQALARHLPLPADFPLGPAIAGKRKPASQTEAQDPLAVEPFACPGPRPMLCVEAGPRKEFAGLLPRLHAGAAELRGGTLVVLLEGAERATVPAVLRALAGAPLLAEGMRP